MDEATSGNREPIFEAHKISKRFGPTLALDHVDLRIYRGEITGLIGENGSGKSTLSSIAAANKSDRRRLRHPPVGYRPPGDG